MHGYIHTIKKRVKNGVGVQQISKERITKAFKQKNLMSFGHKIGNMLHQYMELIENEKVARQARLREIKIKKKKPRIIEILKKNQQKAIEKKLKEKQERMEAEERKRNEEELLDGAAADRIEQDDESESSSSESENESNQSSGGEQKQQQQQKQSDSDQDNRNDTNANQTDKKVSQKTKVEFQEDVETVNNVLNSQQQNQELSSEEQDSYLESDEQDDDQSSEDDSSNSQNEEELQDVIDQQKNQEKKQSNVAQSPPHPPLPHSPTPQDQAQFKTEEQKLNQELIRQTRMRKLITKPTDKKLFKRLSGRMLSSNKLKEKRRSFEDSEWNASKFSGQKQEDSARVKKKPKRTLADILKTIKHEKINQLDEEYQESNIDQNSSGSDRQNDLDKDDKNVIQKRVLGLIQAFSKVTADPMTQFLKATKEGKFSFQIQREERRRAKLRAKHLNQDLDPQSLKQDPLSERAELRKMQYKRSNTGSPKQINKTDSSKSRSPSLNSRQSKPITIAEYIRNAKLNSSSALSQIIGNNNNNPGSSRSKKYIQDIVIPTAPPIVSVTSQKLTIVPPPPPPPPPPVYKPQEGQGLSHCLTIIRSHSRGGNNPRDIINTKLRDNFIRSKTKESTQSKGVGTEEDKIELTKKISAISQANRPKFVRRSQLALKQDSKIKKRNYSSSLQNSKQHTQINYTHTTYETQKSSQLKKDKLIEVHQSIQNKNNSQIHQQIHKPKVQISSAYDSTFKLYRPQSSASGLRKTSSNLLKLNESYGMSIGGARVQNQHFGGPAGATDFYLKMKMSSNQSQSKSWLNKSGSGSHKSFQFQNARRSVYGGFAGRKSSQSPTPPPTNNDNHHKLTSEKQFARPMTSMHVQSKRQLKNNNKGFVKKLFKDLEDRGGGIKRLQMKGKIANFAERKEIKPKYDSFKTKRMIQFSPNNVNSTSPKRDAIQQKSVDVYNANVSSQYPVGSKYYSKSPFNNNTYNKEISNNSLETELTNNFEQNSKILTKPREKYSQSPSPSQAQNPYNFNSNPSSLNNTGISKMSQMKDPLQTLYIANTLKKPTLYNQASMEIFNQHSSDKKYFEDQGHTSQLRIRVGNVSDIKNVLGAFKMSLKDQTCSKSNIMGKRHSYIGNSIKNTTLGKLGKNSQFQSKLETATSSTHTSKGHLMQQLKSQSILRNNNSHDKKKPPLGSQKQSSNIMKYLKVQGFNSRNSKRRPLLFKNLNPVMLAKMRQNSSASLFDSQQNAFTNSGPNSAFMTPLVSGRKTNQNSDKLSFHISNAM